jgi:hypothetical protein
MERRFQNTRRTAVTERVGDFGPEGRQGLIGIRVSELSIGTALYVVDGAEVCDCELALRDPVNRIFDRMC